MQQLTSFLDNNSTLVDKVKLINSAFDAFWIVATRFDAHYAEEFRAIAVTLYSGMLFFWWFDVLILISLFQSF